jgi:hypothetical protein
MSDMTRPGPPWLRKPVRCKHCGGWDVGAVGHILHKRDCPDNPDRDYFDHLDQEHEDDERVRP